MSEWGDARSASSGREVTFRGLDATVLKILKTSLNQRQNAGKTPKVSGVESRTGRAGPFYREIRWARFTFRFSNHGFTTKLVSLRRRVCVYLEVPRAGHESLINITQRQVVTSLPWNSLLTRDTPFPFRINCCWLNSFPISKHEICNVMKTL